MLSLVERINNASKKVLTQIKTTESNIYKLEEEHYKLECEAEKTISKINTIATENSGLLKICHWWMANTCSTGQYVYWGSGSYRYFNPNQ